MPPFVPYAPGAYNWWEGNTFRIPALGQYARPSYAEALAPVASNDPTLAAATPGAVDPRITDHSMVARDGGLGGMPGSAPGVGLNAQAKNAGEFFGSIGRGFGMVSNPIGFGMGVLSANKPASWSDLIPGKGLYDAVQAARDYFSGPTVAESLTTGSGGMAGVDFGNVTGSGQGYSYSDAQSPGSLASSPETGGRQSDRDVTPSTQGDPTLGEGPAFLAKGGRVMARHLAGPNPPGPDDGLAYLDAGEHVINAKQARKHRGLLDAINKGKVSKKKARGLLD